MISRIKSQFSELSTNKLKKSSLEYLSSFVLKIFQLQLLSNIEIFNKILLARGIDPNTDLKKIAFDRLKADLIWCIENKAPDKIDNMRSSNVGDGEYAEPNVAEVAIKKTRDYIIANNKARSENRKKAIVEIVAPKKKSAKTYKAKKTSKKINRKKR
jgi:hypothetical protein